jgi:hypothetical protein
MLDTLLGKLVSSKQVLCSPLALSNHQKPARKPSNANESPKASAVAEAALARQDDETSPPSSNFGQTSPLRSTVSNRPKKDFLSP